MKAKLEKRAGMIIIAGCRESINMNVIDAQSGTLEINDRNGNKPRHMCIWRALRDVRTFHNRV